MQRQNWVSPERTTEISKSDDHGDLDGNSKPRRGNKRAKKKKKDRLTRGCNTMIEPSIPTYEEWLASHPLLRSHGSPWTPPPNRGLTSPPQARRVTSALSFLHKSSYPVQSRQRTPSVPRNKILLPINIHYQVIGNPSLRLFRVRLPPHLLHLLDPIVLGCEGHAATLSKGWYTELYSLTKQDVALREIPHLYNMTRPVTSYITRSIAALYQAQCVAIDRNQPHVLKYSVRTGHTGVELHHDKCDVTANLCLSRSSSYVGGGTYFPSADLVVRLEFGEFLLHPGSLVHGGVNIKGGTRHLMILFAHIK